MSSSLLCLLHSRRLRDCDSPRSPLGLERNQTDANSVLAPSADALEQTDGVLIPFSSLSACVSAQPSLLECVNTIFKFQRRYGNTVRETVVVTLKSSYSRVSRQHSPLPRKRFCRVRLATAWLLTVLDSLQNCPKCDSKEVP